MGVRGTSEDGLKRREKERMEEIEGKWESLRELPPLVLVAPLLGILIACARFRAFAVQDGLGGGVLVVGARASRAGFVYLAGRFKVAFTQSRGTGLGERDGGGGELLAATCCLGSRQVKQ